MTGDSRRAAWRRGDEHAGARVSRRSSSFKSFVDPPTIQRVVVQVTNHLLANNPGFSVRLREDLKKCQCMRARARYVHSRAEEVCPESHGRALQPANYQVRAILRPRLSQSQSSPSACCWPESQVFIVDMQRHCCTLFIRAGVSAEQLIIVRRESKVSSRT